MSDSEVNDNKWLSRLRDPIWQFWGAVFAIMGLAIAAVALYSQYQDQAGPHVSVSQHYQNVLVSQDWPQLETFDVFYEGKPVSNATSLVFKLTNDGRKPIEVDDYSVPFTFVLKPESEIATVKITEKQPESLQFDVTRVNTNTIQLTPALFNPGDSVDVVINVVNRNDLDTPLMIQDHSRISGMAPLVFPDEDTIKDVIVRGNFVFPFWILLMLALATAIGTGLTLFIIRRRVGIGFFYSWMEAKVVAIALGTGTTLFWGLMLSRSIWLNQPPIFWKYWLLPAIIGASLVVLYAIWLTQLFRTSPE